jgi:hypothetical protein
MRRIIFSLIVWIIFLQLNSCNVKGQAENSQAGIKQSETI